jgi:hypothetical protein
VNLSEAVMTVVVVPDRESFSFRLRIVFACRSGFSHYSSDEPMSALFVVALETSMVCRYR